MRPITAGVASLACLMLAACGGDGGGATPAPPTAGADVRIGSPVLATNDPALGAPEPEPGAPPSVSTGAPPLDEVDALPPPVGVGERRAACSGSGRRAILCLVNAERTSRGLRALRSNSALARAAARHSGDMVRRKYFSHDSPSGSSMLDRVRASGFIPRRGTWIVGENLAYGSGSLARPGAIVRSWMASPGHRANILQPRFRLMGIGIARGVPVRGVSGGATYTTNFGARG